MKAGDTRNYNAIPLPIVNDGVLYIIEIPVMSEQAYKFFMDLLDLYEPAIVVKDEPDTPAEGSK